MNHEPCHTCGCVECRCRERELEKKLTQDRIHIGALRGGISILDATLLKIKLATEDAALNSRDTLVYAINEILDEQLTILATDVCPIRFNGGTYSVEALWDKPSNGSLLRDDEAYVIVMSLTRGDN